MGKIEFKETELKNVKGQNIAKVIFKVENIKLHQNDDKNAKDFTGTISLELTNSGSDYLGTHLELRINNNKFGVYGLKLDKTTPVLTLSTN